MHWLAFTVMVTEPYVGDLLKIRFWNEFDFKLTVSLCFSTGHGENLFGLNYFRKAPKTGKFTK